MAKYIVEGGYPVKGKLTASGNKNAALPCLAAALLTDEEVILHNIPDIEDVAVMLHILTRLGVLVEPIGPGSYRIKTVNIVSDTISHEMAGLIRASVLFIGPLLARCGRAKLAPPGGDVIGRRRLDTHFLAMERLGAKTEFDDFLTFNAEKLIGTEIFLDEASVTATENAIMAAALADGESTIVNAACEPHVQDLCHMLKGMGAKISGIGSNILTVKSEGKLRGTEYVIGSDYMEVGSLIGLAAITRGELEIERAQPRHLRMCRIAFNKLGIDWEVEGESILIPARQRMKTTPDFDGSIARIDDAPWPGFPPDLTSIAVVVATQSEGLTLVHEKMFESRLFFVDRLIAMGACITLCDPHRVVISGPAVLSGSTLASPDVRAGMAMVLAALCANGESEINNIYQVERGYVDVVSRLRSIGCQIRRKE